MHNENKTMKKHIGQEFDLNAIYERIYGYVAPVFPASTNLSQLLPSSPMGTINALVEQYKKTLIGTEMLMPLSIGVPNSPIWEVPTEPMVSIKGGHKIIRRFPNRSTKGGSIKERWSSDDYKITIKGFLIEFSKDKYPEPYVKRLREICQHKEAIKVENTLFRIFGIERIVIESYDIPFTQGLPIQGYTINAYSDELFNSLLTEA